MNADRALLAADLETAHAEYLLAKEYCAHARVWVGLATIAQRQGKTVLAEAHLERALQRDPLDAYALGNRGVLAHERGDLEEARSWYQAALDQDPAAAEFRNNLAILEYSDCRFCPVSLRELQKAYSVLPHPRVRANMERMKELSNQ